MLSVFVADVAVQHTYLHTFPGGVCPQWLLCSREQRHPWQRRDGADMRHGTEIPGSGFPPQLPGPMPCRSRATAIACVGSVIRASGGGRRVAGAADRGGDRRSLCERAETPRAHDPGAFSTHAPQQSPMRARATLPSTTQSPPLTVPRYAAFFSTLLHAR